MTLKGIAFHHYNRPDLYVKMFCFDSSSESIGISFDSTAPSSFDFRCRIRESSAKSDSSTLLSLTIKC